MIYNNFIIFSQAFKNYISGNDYIFQDKRENNFKTTNDNMNLSPKFKINNNIKSYLNEYNAKYLKNYVNSKKNKMIISSELFPIDPNNYVKFFSITHILSFLAGYYLSNF